ncbi:hypothetical protein [Parabacteroides johnsonii]|uniref:hypothetical protein n=1 Tax=Parabacteroides johnsonii TaxID=387661 RepID=UPI0016528FF0|nr:hypothetical protein [Parabacteroides johnsonii]
MKQQLDDENIRQLVAYRMERAKETLLEADLLINGGYYNVAVYFCYWKFIKGMK